MSNTAHKPAGTVPLPEGSGFGWITEPRPPGLNFTVRDKLEFQPPAEHVSNTEQCANPLLDQSRARTTQGSPGAQHEVRNTATTRSDHLSFALPCRRGG